MKKRVLGWLAVFALPVFSVYGQLHFQKVVIFGDSLSDNGNTFAVAGLPAPPYYQGRWTNGLNWVDYFSQEAQLPDITAFFADHGTNFAVGDSTSQLLALQIATYLGTAGGRADPSALYIIWTGANDFNAGIQSSTTSRFILGEIGALAAAGAKHLVLIEVPDISLTPDVIAAGSQTVASAKQFVATVNARIKAEAPPLAWLLGLQFALIDVNPLLSQLVYSPTSYGFTNSSGAAYNPETGVVVPNPNDYVFWDGFHPTTRVHQIAAQTFYGIISASFSAQPALVAH